MPVDVFGCDRFIIISAYPLFRLCTTCLDCPLTFAQVWRLVWSEGDEDLSRAEHSPLAFPSWSHSSSASPGRPIVCTPMLILSSGLASGPLVWEALDSYRSCDSFDPLSGIRYNLYTQDEENVSTVSRKLTTVETLLSLAPVVEKNEPKRKKTNYSL